MRRFGRNGPSPHFTWREFACHDTARTPYPERWRARRARILASAAEDVRDHFGVPIPVLSAYRTAKHNQAVGGTRYSKHMAGLGLDLGRPRGVTLLELHEAALVEARKPSSAIRGVGKYLWGVHIDCRQSLRLVVWRGKRLQAEVEVV